MAETTLFNAKTDAQKSAFIEAYCEWGEVYAGMKAASIPRSVYETWMATDDEFARQVMDAHKDSVDKMAMRGKEMARKSPDMMKFMLRSLRPEVYGEKSEQRVTMTRKYQEMTDEELEHQVRLEKSRSGDR